MTLDELLDLPAQELEALTDEQLLEYFGPKLEACRPQVRNELKGVKERSPKKRKVSSSQDMMARLMNLAERAEKLEKEKAQ